MVTITLPPDLERAVTERARQQGTTPEIVTLDTLRQHLLPAEPAPAPGGSLADFLGDFIGCLHSGEVVPGGAQMSADTGRKFAEGMVTKRKAGKL